MAGLVPAIPIPLARCPPKRDCRDIGERSDAVLRTAMPGNDDDDVRSRSRDASASEFSCKRHESFAFQQEGRRSADRRHPTCPHPYGVRRRADRRTSAFRRSTAALARPVATSIGSAPDPRFLRPGSFGCYPLSPVSSLPSTSETGRSAGRSGTQSRPGAVCETARGHRTRSTFRIASRKRPSLNERRLLS